MSGRLSIVGWWIFGIALVVIAALAALGFWGFTAPWAADRQREINVNSQQYQDAQIAEAESLVRGVMQAQDPDQKRLLTSMFCTTFQRITDAPPDLEEAADQYCD